MSKPVEQIEYIEPRPYFYVVGVDLGSVNDSTAITVLEVGRGWEILNQWPEGYSVPVELRRTPDAHFLVRVLHRPRLGTSYPRIIEQVNAIVEDLPGMAKKPIIVFDGTGLGAPVVQMARKSGLPDSISIAITAGQTATLTGRNWSVPKALLVGELRLAMHRNRLKVAAGFQARETLQTELAVFHAKLSASGRATFAAAGQEHDDTVLSLSMAILAAKTRFGQDFDAAKVLGDWFAR